MAARGNFPPSFEGRSVQAPGMMRHGPFPGLGPAAGHRSPSELLENKMAVQAAEMERFTRENQRLAATHVALRQELVATQQEMQRLHAHIGSIQTESDIQIRVLLEKIAKMEADIMAGESIKKDLLQAHNEAKDLVAARQELSSQIQNTTQELQKARAAVKNLPELLSELNSLRQEHQRLRNTFEYEKGLNIERVEQMHAMEKNLMSMAREVEKLRAEVANAERRASAAPNPYGGTPPNSYGGTQPNPYGGTPAIPYGVTGPYANPDPYAAPVTQPDPYAPLAQGANVYLDAYGRPYMQMSNGTSGDGTNLYTSGSNGTAAAVISSEGTGGWGGSYEATNAPPSSLAQR